MEKITATKHELSEMTGLSAFQIDQLRKDKQSPLPAVRVGKGYIYPINEVTEYLKNKIMIGKQQYYAANNH